MSNLSVNSHELKEIKSMIVEITNCLSRIDGEREQIKDIASAVEDKFNIKKKLVNKVARTMYKHNYADLQTENKHFEFLFEAVANGKQTQEQEKE